ncbi:MAG: hypothetical protein QOJ35_2590 [Solirubrobacteraceae bacterium]|jgi:hypothetical protein|nr:hypothetical protein [Solirubrobacteraceae bacterium]
MFRVLHRKSVVAAGLVAVLSAAGAYAYWTQDGSGIGAAETATTQAITVNQTGSVTPLFPGGSPQDLSGDFDNPNPGPVRVHLITATIDAVTGDNIDGDHPCTAADYELDGLPVAVNHEIASGDAVDGWSGASIEMPDSGSNQDGCKNATVHLSYSSN